MTSQKMLTIGIVLVFTLVAEIEWLILKRSNSVITGQLGNVRVNIADLFLIGNLFIGICGVFLGLITDHNGWSATQLAVNFGFVLLAAPTFGLLTKRFAHGSRAGVLIVVFALVIFAAFLTWVFLQARRLSSG